MGQRFPGTTGTIGDFTALDAGTSAVQSAPSPGVYCASGDPNVLRRTGYVLDAWELAKGKYAFAAIVKHTEKDFYDLIKGALPMLFVAAGIVLTTTIIGAIAGAFVGGVGAAPGAAVGFAIGTTLLEALGLAFLVIYLKDRVKDIAVAMHAGAVMAWNSCGDRGAIDAGARSMAEGIGLFYAALLQALLLYLGAALASKTLTASRNALRGSKLFKACEKLEAWLNKNFAELYKKHIGKPAPGILPPITATLDDWAAYIKALEFKPPRDKGMLWSKIGEAKATALAKQKGMTSLEMLLEENGFRAAYKEQFGTAQTAVTEQVWKLVSEQYARSLQGKVSAYIDSPALAKAIKEAPAKPIKDLKPGESAIKGPQITNELMEISSVMEKNPNISSVAIYDIAKPDVMIKLMTREMVQQSKAAPLQ